MSWNVFNSKLLCKIAKMLLFRVLRHKNCAAAFTFTKNETDHRAIRTNRQTGNQRYSKAIADQKRKMYCALCSMRYALCSVQYALCIVQCVVCTLQCAWCIVHGALYNVQCLLCNAILWTKFDSWWRTCSIPATLANCSQLQPLAFAWGEW